MYTFLFVSAVLQHEVTSVISSQHSCRVTRICLQGHRASFTRVFTPGGVDLADGTWVEEGSLVEPNAAVYGLVNAPTAWRKTIVRGIESLGYRRSCYDLCIFCLMDESGPQGHILIEVDDLAIHGNAVHAGRTVIQDQSYGFHVHQAKFVQERDCHLLL